MTQTKRKRKKNNHYFTKVHEDAIIKYTASNCRVEKGVLYEQLIGPAFDELVDKITFTYKFTTLPNIDSLREECKFWLVTILDKYDPNKGSKAFSYFSVVTKNWFIHKVKKTSKQVKREISFENLEFLKAHERDKLVAKNEYLNKREKEEFWEFLLKELQGWELEEEGAAPSSNDLRVLKSITELLNNPDDVEILNKKAIYLYMREITGLNTKQIANSLKKFKIKYRSFKKEWIRGEI